MNLIKQNPKDPFKSQAYDRRKLRFVVRRCSGLEIFIYGLIGVVGLVIATLHPVIGGFQALFGFARMTHREEVWFDLEEGRYKKVTSILSFHIGNWEYIPDDNFLLLKHLSDARNRSSIWGNFTDRRSYYKIFLKSRDQVISLELLTEIDEERAIESAHELVELFSSELKIDIDNK